MIAFLARILGGLFTSRSLLFSLITVVLGLVFYNLICEVVQEVMSFALNQINGASYGSYSSPSFSGFTGWVIGQCKVPECLSVVTSAVAIKFILRKIPFLKW
jgi:hypothetical protein